MPSVAHIIRRRRNRKQRRHHLKQTQRLWGSFVVLLLASAILVPSGVILGLAGYLYGRAVAHMPSPAETIYVDPMVGATQLLDRSASTVIYTIEDPLGDDRQWLDIETLPDYVTTATLVMENNTNYLNTSRFSLPQTIGRLWRYTLGYDNRRDNTITGLLVDRSLIPAVRESGLDETLLHIAFTAEINRQYSSRRVLEWYLNTANYGNDAYGLSAAAQVYFGKPATELTLDEAALLASIPPRPERNPLDDLTRARGQQRQLLQAMLTNNLITQAQFDNAASTETAIRDDLTQAPAIAPHFSVYAREQAEEILNRQGMQGAARISRGGLRITTTLDVDLYYQAECTLQAHLSQVAGGDKSATTRHNRPCVASAYLRDMRDDFASTSPPNAGTLLIQDVQSGEIRAMVGDATAQAHAPAVTLHPFVYLTGFISGNFNAGSMVLDIPQQFPGIQDGLIYTPINPDGLYRGPINLRDAMTAGLRAPVTEVAEREGMSNVISIAHQMGITGLTDVNIFDLSLIERGGAVSVLDMTYAYSVFANMGVMQGVDTDPVGIGFRARNPVAVLKIEDAAGNVLWAYDETRRALSQTPLLEDEIAYLVNDILSDSGTRRQVLNIDDEMLSIGRPVALMNGLSRNQSDSWTVGYTPQLAVGVHLGRTDASTMALDVQGVQGAAAVWQALMRFAHDRYDYSAAGWARPNDIVEYIVCDRSGLIRTDDNDCPARSEIYLRNAAPAQEDTYWRTVQINSQTGFLASSSTPAYLIVEEVYFEPPTGAREWWVSNGLALPPTEFDTITRPEALSSAAITQPRDFSYVGGVVAIRGSIDTENMTSWRLRFGRGLNPTSWLDIGTPQDDFAADAPLAEWDTSALDGLYTLELSVAYADGQRETTAVNVTVDNVAPEITLGTQDERTIYRFPERARIPLVAQASDNLTAIDRVAFYNDGVLVFIDEDAPYQYDFPIERAGDTRFSARAYDQVGNQSETTLDIQIIRGR